LYCGGCSSEGRQRDGGDRMFPAPKELVSESKEYSLRLSTSLSYLIVNFWYLINSSQPLDSQLDVFDIANGFLVKEKLT
jgi:hypothetical protein